MTDGPWTRGMKAAVARGDTHEVKALRGSIYLLLSMAANPELSERQFDAAYAQMAEMHGLGPIEDGKRDGWRRAAGQLMLVK